MIAVDIPNSRIYVRGNMHDAYRWLQARYKENWCNLLTLREFPICWIRSAEHSLDFEWLPAGGWTVEWQPEVQGKLL